MNLVEKINDKLKTDKSEAMHHNMKVRQLEGMGSRKARLTIKEAYKMGANMMDEMNPAPNPRTPMDKKMLGEAMKLMEYAMDKLKPIKESKSKAKMKKMKESLSEAKMDDMAMLSAQILNSMIMGKFKGKPDQLIDSLSDEFEELEDLGANEKKVAKALIDLKAALGA